MCIATPFWVTSIVRAGLEQTAKKYISKSITRRRGSGIINGPKCTMFLMTPTAYPTLRKSCVSYEFSHPIFLTWSAEHAYFTFRSPHFHTSTRRPAVLTDVFHCLLQSFQTNVVIVETIPTNAQPQFRCRWNSMQSLYTEVKNKILVTNFMNTNRKECWAPMISHHEYYENRNDLRLNSRRKI